MDHPIARQGEVRAEPGMSMQTGRRMERQHLLNYSVLKYCLDTQGDIRNILPLQQQKNNNIDATYIYLL